MANNHLYLFDPETGESCLLAKGWARGWELSNPDAIAGFLEGRDIQGALGKSTSLVLMTESDDAEVIAKARAIHGASWVNSC